MPPTLTPAEMSTNYAAACIASEHLAASGYAIHALDAETQFGVLPIVATKATPRGRALVFFSLRVTDHSRPHSPPIGARDAAAARALRRASAAWINAAGPLHGITEMRWDAVGITFTDGDHAHFEHVQNVF